MKTDSEKLRGSEKYTAVSKRMQIRFPSMQTNQHATISVTLEGATPLQRASTGSRKAINQL